MQKGMLQINTLHPQVYVTVSGNSGPRTRGLGLGKEGIRMTPAWGGASGTNDLEEEGDQL